MQSLKQARVNHESAKGREFKQYFRFAETILEEANNTFSVMYHNIFRKAWNNSEVAKLPHNQVLTDWEKGEYECYMPTIAHAEVSCLQFYRIIIKVLPEIDRETIDKQIIDLQRPRVKPLGFIDSELIVFVARHRSKRAAKEKQTWRYGGRLRGFKHIKKPGFLTAIIVDRNPHICMKRLLTLIANFLKKRLKGLLKSLNLEPWQTDYTREEDLYYIQTHIIESFSYVIAQTFKVLSESLKWILKCLKRTLEAIGNQNKAIEIDRAAKKLVELVKEYRLERSEIGSRLRKETETVLNSLELFSNAENHMKKSLKPKSEAVKVPIRLCLKARYT